MKRNHLLLIPLFLTLSIFLLDKLALVEAIRDYGRPEPTPIENVLIHLQTAAAEMQNSEQPVYFILGTSRSDRFKYLDRTNILAAPEITTAEKQNLLNIKFETRAILKASELFLQYTLLESVVRQGGRPALTIVEVSPEMFNAGSPFNMRLYLSNHIYDLTLLRKTLSFLEGPLRYETLKRLAFPTYAYRFRPERALTNFLRGYRPMEAQFAVSLMRLFEPIQPLPENYEDFEAENIPPEIYRQRFTGYADFLEKENILMNYRYDPAELRALIAIMNLAQTENLPLVLWTPDVHETLEVKWGKMGENPIHPRVTPEIGKHGIPYFNASTHNMLCRRFSDASHLSGRCSPYLMTQIIEMARSKYGRL